MRVIWSSERDFSGRKFLSLPEESDNRFNGDMFTVSVLLRASIFYGYIAVNLYFALEIWE
jgi:hypothetical protein